ncbi:MAG: hypothetical protein ACI9QD_000940 [Thermoproteota archaeon]|jgi:hypothetical protein
MTDINQNFIFFIQFDEKLPNYYYSLAEQYNKLKITLIPVDAAQFVHFINQKEIVFAICSTTSLAHYDAFNKKLFRVVKSAINNNLLNMIHLSSFSKLNMSYRNIHSKNYFFMDLPVKVEEVIKYSARFFWAKKLVARKWPGGSRARVPDER